MSARAEAMACGAAAAVYEPVQRAVDRPTLADVFRRYGPAYLEKYGDAVPAAHRKVMHAIVHRAAAGIAKQYPTEGRASSPEPGFLNGGLEIVPPS